MSYYQSIVKFLSGLRNGLATDITVPQSITINVEDFPEGKRALTARISYDVDHKMLIPIIKNYRQLFNSPGWGEKCPEYDPSPRGMGHFTWDDGTRITISSESLIARDLPNTNLKNG